MTDRPVPKEGRTATLRLVFSLERAEDPRLYDDLVAMRKGVKRAARLRLLAHDGLLLQQGIRGGDAGRLGVEGSGPTQGLTSAVITNQVFGPPVDE